MWHIPGVRFDKHLCLAFLWLITYSDAEFTQTPFQLEHFRTQHVFMRQN